MNQKESLETTNNSADSVSGDDADNDKESAEAIVQEKLNNTKIENKQESQGYGVKIGRGSSLMGAIKEKFPEQNAAEVYKKLVNLSSKQVREDLGIKSGNINDVWEGASINLESVLDTKIIKGNNISKTQDSKKQEVVDNNETVVVESGDNLTKIIRRNYPDVDVSSVITKLKEMSPKEVKKQLGIKSGDIGVIQKGEQLNLAQFIESKKENNITASIKEKNQEKETSNNDIGKNAISKIQEELKQLNDQDDLTRGDIEHIQSLQKIVKKLEEKISKETIANKGGDVPTLEDNKKQLPGEVAAVDTEQLIEQQIVSSVDSSVDIKPTQMMLSIEKASKLTGVDKDVIAGVCAQESHLGLNANKGVSYDSIESKMSKQRQKTFVKIMQELNRDPKSVKVSQAGETGTGGAMGPAQILPETWESVKDRVKQLTGKKTPDPYNADDAAAAMAVILDLNGVKRDEGKAYRMYFCGNNSEGKECYAYQKSAEKWKTNYKSLIKENY